MKAVTVELYIKNLVTICDEMLETLQKARLDRKDIERWERVVDSYRKHSSNSVIYSDLEKYI